MKKLNLVLGMLTVAACITNLSALASTTFKVKPGNSPMTCLSQKPGAKSYQNNAPTGNDELTYDEENHTMTLTNCSAKDPGCGRSMPVTNGNYYSIPLAGFDSPAKAYFSIDPSTNDLMITEMYIPSITMGGTYNYPEICKGNWAFEPVSKGA